jgi:hypothetical protein
MADPFMVFDWYFTDVSERDAARFQALAARKTETILIMDLIEADSLVNFALWSKLPKNHPVADLWLETQTDLLASIYLAYGGFFRQALAVDRCWFEITVHSVYYSGHYLQKNSRYNQWRAGKRNAPVNMDKIARSLAARKDLAIAVDEATILAKLKPLYSSLSQHAHAQGLDVYKYQEGRDNVPRYLSQSYDIWYKALLDTFDCIAFLIRIFFPNQIAAYLKDSKSELDRANKLENSLKLPDFSALMNDVFNIMKS